MFFGINESTSRWFSSSKPRGLSSSASGSSSVLASSSPKPISKPMLNTSRLPRVDVDNLTLPIQPYDDLSWIFRSPMSQANDNNAPAGKGSRCLPTPGSPWQVLDLSGSTLANSSFPSGSSGALLEAFSNLKDLKPLETSTPPSWRWHKHLAKRQHSKNNNSGEPRSAHTTVTDAKAVDDGRKSVLGMKRPFSRLKKHSGLPVLPPGEP
ncbi:hypothetical protein CPB83DRAFT_847755 [Crepidotus variabilis]|uniref:Uncharacterized protein n=1 Tax=Crepidotus variabilis TaxID=179855 RepID=A0A9P6ENV9_9AGAR|nr:hypothetical protein CPB83DRAFT_847755 [Crepidotus variabilis]